MSEKYNSTCAICGKQYNVCNTCLEQKTFRPWRTITDSIEHYKIYLAIHGYSLTKNKEKAKFELEQCDLSELESLNPEIRSVIKKIMEEPRKAKNASKKIKQVVEFVEPEGEINE